MELASLGRLWEDGGLTGGVESTVLDVGGRNPEENSPE